MKIEWIVSRFPFLCHWSCSGSASLIPTYTTYTYLGSKLLNCSPSKFLTIVSLPEALAPGISKIWLVRQIH